MTTMLTVEQVSELLHLSRERVRTLARAGELPSFTLPGRRRRYFPADQIVALIRPCPVEPEPAEASA